MKLIEKRTETLYNGNGYTQGMGVIVSQDVTILFRKFRFVTGIHFYPEPEWTRLIKRNIAADDKQQALEKSRQ